VAEEARPGIKRLTLANWTEPDPANEHFVRYSDILQEMVAMDGGDWARLFLGCDLQDHVPDEIRDMFEVARGAVLYGWFFYPMYELGQEQLFRVSEAAARRCCAALGNESERLSFYAAIGFLAKKGVIDADDRHRWEAARKLRNSSSHPERASVMPPGAIASLVEATATDINHLFLEARRLQTDNA
jgi:hypothetical protein